MIKWFDRESTFLTAPLPPVSHTRVKNAGSFNPLDTPTPWPPEALRADSLQFQFPRIESWDD